MKLEIEPLRDDTASEDTDDECISVDGPSNDEPIMKCEVREYEERHNLRGEKITKLLEDKVEVDGKDEGKDYAMISHKHYNLDGSLNRSRIEIQSPHIIKALREVIKTYPGQSFNGITVILHGMLTCIFHYRRELKEYGEKQEHPVSRWHVHLILRFMSKELRSSIRSYEAHVETSKAKPSIEFHDLWMVFIPGELILSGSCERRQISILRSMKLKKDSCGNEFWSVIGRCFTHDGTNFGYSDKIVEISNFAGTKEIRKLPTWPLRWLDDQVALERVKRELVARGEKFISLTGYHHRTFTGRATVVSNEYEREASGSRTPCPPESSQWRYRLDSITINSRIMVDSKTFGEFNTHNRVWLVERKNQSAESDDKSDSPTTEELMICDFEIPGYSLHDKKWCWFPIDFIQPVPFNDHAFQSLLIPQRRKDLVQALVTNHGSDEFDDMIKGKGKGLVFVLYGEPGVGKTFTAESIADDVKRPLYMLNTGELGVTPLSVETNLNTALKLATRWGAIVLIDEADVFLEQRTIHDLTRNALVSLFLRILEYYEGILFLTTNRLTSFDMAFKSRIHLALKYSALEQDRRKELWKLFLNRVSKEILESWPDSVIDELSKVNINGRQIKNTVRTANTLARSDRTSLTKDHIEVVLETMAELEEDLNGSTQDVVLP